MRTLVTVITIGDRDRWIRLSHPRFERWCRAHALDLVLVRQPLMSSDPAPHFNKLAVLARFPGYDRYVIADDDLLISRHAPPPPEVPPGFIGLTPDAEQRHTSAPYVEFTGNTGFVVADAGAAPIFADALARGRDPTILGTNDQSALNRSAWQARRIHRLDGRWNHLPVVHHIVSRDVWPAWSGSRLHRLAFYLRLLPGAPTTDRRLLREAYGVHLVRVKNPAVFGFLAL